MAIVQTAQPVPIQRFNGGEIDPMLWGRTDLPWYSAACVMLRNAIATPHGPATMRAGSYHCGVPRVTAVPIDNFVKLMPFKVSVETSYVVEATDLKLRFWQGGVRSLVLDAFLAPIEVVSPWPVAKLSRLRWLQSVDTMWILHPEYEPQKLVRTGPVGGPYNFTLTPVVFVDGPYYPTNVTPTTFTFSGVGPGAGTVAASTATFSALDIGRLIRFGSGTTWGYAQIVAPFIDATNANVVIKAALPGVGPSNSWRLGLYSPRTGYPSCGTFHQERLFFGSNPASSFARVDGSSTDDFDNFRPGAADADAVAYALATNDLPIIYELVSDRSLVAFTSSTELKIGNEQSTVAMTTTAPPQVIRISAEGSADVGALKVKRGMLFVQRYQLSLNEIAYAVDSDGLQTREVSIRAGHIGGGDPFVGLVWANRPYNVAWMWGAGGTLAGCTYTPEQEVTAFHRHRLGGAFRLGAPVIESMASIPGAHYDETWLAVKRTIGGVTTRQIAVFADRLKDFEPPDEAVYLDQAIVTRGLALPAGISFSNIVDATATTDGTVDVTADAAVFIAGDVGQRILAVQQDGEDEAGMPAFKRLDLEIDTYHSPTSVSCTRRSAWLPAANALAQNAWRFGITTVSVPHLIGETVGVLGDGAKLEPRVVPATGFVTVDRPAAVITVGLLYKMILQPVQADAVSRSRPTSITKLGRVTSVGLNMHRSGPFSVGTPRKVYQKGTRVSTDPLDEAPPLFTGVMACDIGSSDSARRPYWRLEAEGPLPVTVTSAVPYYLVGDANQ